MPTSAKQQQYLPHYLLVSGDFAFNGDVLRGRLIDKLLEVSRRIGHPGDQRLASRTGRGCAQVALEEKIRRRRKRSRRERGGEEMRRPLFSHCIIHCITHFFFPTSIRPPPLSPTASNFSYLLALTHFPYSVLLIFLLPSSSIFPLHYPLHHPVNQLHHPLFPSLLPSSSSFFWCIN